MDPYHIESYHINPFHMDPCQMDQYHMDPYHVSPYHMDRYNKTYICYHNIQFNFLLNILIVCTFKFKYKNGLRIAIFNSNQTNM